MPKIIHQSKGLKIVQNDKNGFTVVSLHYTADPRKRSKEWEREARQGLSEAKFNQEYNIDYAAQMGEKIFPEVKSRQNEIIVQSGPFVDNAWPRDLPMWGGFDFGMRNPSSFHVYTIYDDVIYAIWELYKPCKNLIEFAKDLKACPYWDQIKYIACDPDIWNLKQIDSRDGGKTTIAQMFLQQGVSKFIQGNNNESSWIAAMQKYWMEPNPVGFKILTCCPMLIDEFECATYVQMSDRQLETQDYREAMIDKHNHALDDCKYFVNSNPNIKSRKIKLPTLIGGFSSWKHEYTRPNTQHRNEYW